MGSHFNALAFTSDGNQAVAYLDYESSSDLDFGGLLNATEVVFMDLDSGATTPVPVGFAADRILFDKDDTKAVVFSAFMHITHCFSSSTRKEICALIF